MGEQNLPQTLFFLPSFSGRVVLKDGVAPSEPVLVELVCLGPVPGGDAYTDTRGRFVVQSGHQGATPAYPLRGGSNSTRAGSVALDRSQLLDCELRASLPGYGSGAIKIGRDPFESRSGVGFNVGLLILQNSVNVEGHAISFTNASAPKNARAAYTKARDILMQKDAKQPQAIHELEKAVHLYPQYAAAWKLLGELRWAGKDEPGARAAFERAIAADPKYLGPYPPLVLMNLDARRWSDAAALAERLLALNPGSTQTYYFHALANFNLGRLEVAEQSARRAAEWEEGKTIPHAHRVLGAILARRGDLSRAAEAYRAYLRFAPDDEDAREVQRALLAWEAAGAIRPTLRPTPRNGEDPLEQRFVPVSDSTELVRLR